MYSTNPQYKLRRPDSNELTQYGVLVDASVHLVSTLWHLHDIRSMFLHPRERKAQLL